MIEALEKDLSKIRRDIGKIDSISAIYALGLEALFFLSLLPNENIALKNLMWLGVLDAAIGFHIHKKNRNKKM